MKKEKELSLKKIKTIFYILLLIGIIFLIYVSVVEYQKEAEAQGIIVCNENECIKTMHIHADIEFDLCGQTLNLPRETGPLNGLHTHKEKNYLHFHDKIQINPETKEQFFDKRLSIQEVIDVFELRPENYCKISDVIIEVMVNEKSETLEYNWKDDDEIKLTYKQK